MNLKETGCERMECIHLAVDRGQWRAVVYVDTARFFIQRGIRDSYFVGWLVC
jgi:hypothetical protein